MDILIFVTLLGILGFIVYDKFFLNKGSNNQEQIAKLEEDTRMISEQNQKLQIDLDHKNEKVGELQSELKKEQSEKNELTGKSKQMFVNLTGIQEKFGTIQLENQDLKKSVVTFESKKEKQDKEFADKVSELEHTRKLLEDEKVRIRKEDEQRIENEEAERNRIWNEHENVAIAKMKEICVKPELSFSFYDNTTLPESFDGKLKPDFMIELLGQYMIFDAKMTKSASLQNYISEQVKSTVKKIEAISNKDEIYPSIFFVVPSIEISTLKKTSYYEEGYHFYVIPIESFEPILFSYKKIMDYDLADRFDPKDREDIINVIAHFDQHIHRQNAFNILSSIEGLKVSSMKSNLNETMADEIEVKKKKMRIDNFKPSDLKKFIQSPEDQIKEMKKLIIPRKPEIETDDNLFS